MEYELYHYGVKGQKWGIRRYQNKDGSLTNAGQKRYNRDEAKKRDWSDDAKSASALRGKSVNQMSNAELKKLNERTRLEQEYSRLNPNMAQKGWKYVAAAAGVMGTALAVYNNSNQIINIGKKAGNAIIDIAGNMVMKDLARGLS